MKKTAHKPQNVEIVDFQLGTEVTPVCSLSTATKELENPEDTAEKVGISAIMVQVSFHSKTSSTRNKRLHFLVCLCNVVEEEPPLLSGL